MIQFIKANQQVYLQYHIKYRCLCKAFQLFHNEEKFLNENNDGPPLQGRQGRTRGDHLTKR